MDITLQILKNRKWLTCKEFNTFQNHYVNIISQFAEKLTENEGGGDRPDEINITANPKSVLSTAIATCNKDIEKYEVRFNLSKKLVQTKELIEVNNMRLDEFGLIKKSVYSIYKLDKANKNAEMIWYRIRNFKNTRKLKLTAIHSDMTNFVTEMESDTYKEACKALNLTTLIQSLKKRNEKFTELSIIRSTIQNYNNGNIIPYRSICEANYEMLHNVVNSIITLDPYSDFSEFIVQSNGHINYYKNMIEIKKTKSKNRNEKEEPSDKPEIIDKN